MIRSFCVTRIPDLGITEHTRLDGALNLLPSIGRVVFLPSRAPGRTQRVLPAELQRSCRRQNSLGLFRSWPVDSEHRLCHDLDSSARSNTLEIAGSCLVYRSDSEFVTHRRHVRPTLGQAILARNKSLPVRLHRFSLWIQECSRGVMPSR